MCLVAQELPPRRPRPSRSRAEPTATQERADRARRDPDPKLGQLAPDPQAPPPRVLPSHPKDQLPNVIDEWRPPTGGIPAIGPFPADELAVPTQERLRTHQERKPPWARENPADRRHEQPVSTAKARPPHLTLEHRQLMAKDHDLDVVGQFAGRGGHEPDCPAHQHVDEGEEHGADLLPGRGSQSYEPAG